MEDEIVVVPPARQDDVGPLVAVEIGDRHAEARRELPAVGRRSDLREPTGPVVLEHERRRVGERHEDVEVTIEVEIREPEARTAIEPLLGRRGSPEVEGVERGDLFEPR